MTQNALLKMLETDALMSDGQIAARLGVEAADVADVAELRARLEAEGRIVGYQAILNDDKEGESALIEVRCSFLISGGFDHLILVEAKTLLEVARFEQDADMTGLRYRTAYYAEDEEARQAAGQRANLLLAKNRNGATGDVPLSFVAELMRFVPRVPDEADEGE